MMQYDGDLKLPTNFLVPPPEIKKVSVSVCVDAFGMVYLSSLQILFACA